MSAIHNPASGTTFMLLDTPVASRKKPMPVIVRAKEGESRLVFTADPVGLPAEQYRVLRRKLVERYPHGAVVLITSAMPGDGKKLTSTNLAWSFAEGGMPTLLAEMDLRKPSVAKLLGYSCESAGIDSLLTGDDEPENILRQVNRMELYVAAAGRPHSNPVDMITGSRLTSFLAWARQRHQWIVLDAPPLFPISDSLELSALADFTLLVVRARVTPRIMVEKSIELLGPRLKQVLMNEGTECTDSAYRYLSAYYPNVKKKK